MRKKPPRRVSPDEVRITREGEIAVIEHADPSVSVARVSVGPQLHAMSDADGLILEDMDQLFVPRLDDALEARIADLVVAAKRSREEASNGLRQAEETMALELGLSPAPPAEPLSYTPCLSGYHPHPLYVVCLLGLQARAGAGALRRRSG